MAITKDDFFDDEYYAQFPELAEQAQGAAESAFPADNFSAEDSAQLQALKDRIQRLSPIETPQGVPSSRIPGNPYSYNNAPVVNATRNAIIKGINAFRERRLQKDDVREKAEGLQAEKESDQQAKQAQQEMFKQMYPEMFGKMMDLQSNLRQQEAEQKDSLKRIRERTKQSIKEWEQTTGKDGGSGSNPAQSVGAVTQVLGQADPYIKNLNNTIQQLEGQIEFADDPEELRSRINNLKSERAELQRWVGDAQIALGNGNIYDPELIGRFEKIIDAGQGNDPDPDSDRTFVEEMMQWYQENDMQPPSPQMGGTPASAGADTVQDTVSSGVDWGGE